MKPKLQYYPGTFAASTGFLRAGKTMNAVRIAAMLYRRGWPVVSNVSIQFARRIQYIQELLEVRQSVIVWDEIQATLDSRDWGSDKARNLTQEGILFGKRGNIVLYTCPHFGMVDVRFRQLTQWVYTCRKVQFREQPVSVLELYWYPGVGEVYTLVSKRLMYHRNYYGLYSTLDEKVALTNNPSVSVPSSSRRSSPLSPSPREAQPRGEGGVDFPF